MTKAEEIATRKAEDSRSAMNGLRGYDILLDDTIRTTIQSAIDEALEWAALQCEEWASQLRGQSHRGKLNQIDAHVVNVLEQCTEEIRAGKSQ